LSADTVSDGHMVDCFDFFEDLEFLDEFGPSSLEMDVNFTLPVEGEREVHEVDKTTVIELSNVGIGGVHNCLEESVVEHSFRLQFDVVGKLVGVVAHVAHIGQVKLKLLLTSDGRLGNRSGRRGDHRRRVGWVNWVADLVLIVRLVFVSALGHTVFSHFSRIRVSYPETVRHMSIFISVLAFLAV